MYPWGSKNGQEPALRERADAENARVAAGAEARAASSGILAKEAEDSCLEATRLDAVVSWRRARAADIFYKDGGEKRIIFRVTILRDSDVTP